MPICHVDVIDACHLKCQTCVRGIRGMPNTGAKMPVAHFERIVSKAKSEGYNVIGLYNWTEPFLNPRIADYITLVKDKGLYCDISTTLSFSGREGLIEQGLRAGLDTMTVSVSGFDQDIHVINHRGSDLGMVRANLEFISRFKRRERTPCARVTLRFLKFAYNADQETKVGDYAESLGFDFEVMAATGDPTQPFQEYGGPEAYLDRLRSFMANQSHVFPGKICPLITDSIAITPKGRATLCCANPSVSFLEVGDYLTTSKEELLLTRFTHPLCASCNFPRRTATQADRAAFSRALLARLGAPSDTMLSDTTEVVTPPARIAPKSRVVGRTLKRVKTFFNIRS